MAYKTVTELAANSSLKFSDVSASERARLGNLVECRVTEQAYGPHGQLWIGAWMPPEDQPTTAK